MPPLEGVVPTLTPQGIGEGDRPKWHSHRAGGKGGTDTLATLWSMLAAEEGNQQFPCQLVWDLVPGCSQAF